MATINLLPNNAIDFAHSIKYHHYIGLIIWKSVLDIKMESGTIIFIIRNIRKHRYHFYLIYYSFFFKT